jgi:hypothetical protein
MALYEDDPKVIDSGVSARTEYELSVKTQTHFNEILMKFRSFGVTVVVAVYSYAVGRPSGELIAAIGATSSQVIAITGLILTVVFAFIDIGYFFPLLLGAVRRALVLEKTTTYRLTSTISGAVPQRRAYVLVIIFYSAIVLSGAFLAFVVLPNTEGMPQATHKMRTSIHLR